MRAASGGRAATFETLYLVGADGVFSAVRSRLFPRAKFETVAVLQELWEARGDFGDYFYMFLRGGVSPAYAYVMPKGGLLLIGVGAPPESLEVSMEKFRRWLAGEFAFEPESLVRREAWAVPSGTVVCGKGRVILAGDAGGFCKPFVGEGIRLAVESGAAAAEAVRRAEKGGREVVSVYAELTAPLRALIGKMREFASKLATDEDREAFVRSELSCRTA
ncbi:MAG TPA: hypothetical protein EYP10_09440 [Armatimonadetes bacterium]|nr:hypothetical protein [Armatimonadota bacterium]